MSNDVRYVDDLEQAQPREEATVAEIVSPDKPNAGLAFEKHHTFRDAHAKSQVASKRELRVYGDLPERLVPSLFREPKTCHIVVQ